MDYRQNLRKKNIIVVKIGTSTLTYPNGRLNFNRISRLAMILSDIRNSGKKVLLVSSGAIAVGTGRLGYNSKPVDLPGKQASAAIGQAILMKIYQKLFDEYNQMIAQVLLTKDVMTDEVRKKNAQNTLHKLLEMDIIPIINENDTVSVDEIQFGDNDTLSAMVSVLIQADLLIMLSDIDGFYTDNPKKNASAKRLPIIETITEDIELAASGKGSDFATGGMITKILAAKMCLKYGVNTIIADGSRPEIIFDILNGDDVGTLFPARERMH